MKFIKTFDQLEAVKIPDSIVKGSTIIYQGSKYKVIDVNDVILTLSSLKTEKEMTVNASQLLENGYKILEG